VPPDLGDNNAMILRHHGLLTTGRTVGDAFYQMYYLEQACQLQVAATQGGQKVVVPSDSVAEHAAQQLESFESKGQRPWAALKRRPRKPQLRDVMRGANDLQICAPVRG
jgi:ribulose-5-phosphate 4-epimerase/fuculose-1-phosphate aldolase